MIKELKNSFGLSFVELLFTLAILGITMISISSLLVSTTKINKESEIQYQATLLAQRYLEKIKASDTVSVGKTVINSDNTKATIDIIEIEKYESKLYKIVVEISFYGEIYERLEGYKIITQ